MNNFAVTSQIDDLLLSSNNDQVPLNQLQQRPDLLNSRRSTNPANFFQSGMSSRRDSIMSQNQLRLRGFVNSLAEKANEPQALREQKITAMQTAAPVIPKSTCLDNPEFREFLKMNDAQIKDKIGYMFIRLDKEDQFYQPGETVKGSVFFQLLMPTAENELFIKFEGVQTVPSSIKDWVLGIKQFSPIDSPRSEGEDRKSFESFRGYQDNQAKGDEERRKQGSFVDSHQKSESENRRYSKGKQAEVKNPPVFRNFNRDAPVRSSTYSNFTAFGGGLGGGLGGLGGGGNNRLAESQFHHETYLSSGDGSNAEEFVGQRERSSSDKYAPFPDNSSQYLDDESSEDGKSVGVMSQIVTNHKPLNQKRMRSKKANLENFEGGDDESSHIGSQIVDSEVDYEVGLQNNRQRLREKVEEAGTTLPTTNHQTVARKRKEELDFKIPIFFNMDKLFQFRLNIAKKGKVKPGQFQLPFTFTIPKGPSSFYFRNADGSEYQVKYIIEVHFKGHLLECRREIQVVQDYSTLENLSEFKPFSSSEKSKIGFVGLRPPQEPRPLLRKVTDRSRPSSPDLKNLGKKRSAPTQLAACNLHLSQSMTEFAYESIMKRAEEDDSDGSFGSDYEKMLTILRQFEKITEDSAQQSDRINAGQFPKGFRLLDLENDTPRSTKIEVKEQVGLWNRIKIPKIQLPDHKQQSNNNSSGNAEPPIISSGSLSSSRQNQAVELKELDNNLKIRMHSCHFNMEANHLFDPNQIRGKPTNSFHKSRQQAVNFASIETSTNRQMNLKSNEILKEQTESLSPSARMREEEEKKRVALANLQIGRVDIKHTFPSLVRPCLRVFSIESTKVDVALFKRTYSSSETIQALVNFGKMAPHFKSLTLSLYVMIEVKDPGGNSRILNKLTVCERVLETFANVDGFTAQRQKVFPKGIVMSLDLKEAQKKFEEIKQKQMKELEQADSKTKPVTKVELDPEFKKVTKKTPSSSHPAAEVPATNGEPALPSIIQEGSNYRDVVLKEPGKELTEVHDFYYLQKLSDDGSKKAVQLASSDGMIMRTSFKVRLEIERAPSIFDRILCSRKQRCPSVIQLNKQQEVKALGARPEKRLQILKRELAKQTTERNPFVEFPIHISPVCRGPAKAIIEKNQPLHRETRLRDSQICLSPKLRTNQLSYEQKMFLQNYPGPLKKKDVKVPAEFKPFKLPGSHFSFHKEQVV